MTAPAPAPAPKKDTGIGSVIKDYYLVEKQDIDNLDRCAAELEITHKGLRETILLMHEAMSKNPGCDTSKFMLALGYKCGSIARISHDMRAISTIARLRERGEQ